MFGFQVYTVLSGSMEPAYPVGSLIYVKETDVTQLSEGDVITFKLTEKTTATHRITEVISEGGNQAELRFRTKGDANEEEDKNLVDSGDVIGEPVFTVPYLGYLATYMQTPPGMYVAIAVSASIILLVILIDTVTDDKKAKGDCKNEDKNKSITSDI